jgi:fatty-acyl-CoA synthase
MMAVPLSTNTMFARMDKLFGQSEVISRLPDKRLVRHSFTEIAARTRALAHALKDLGIKKGDCVATLCWNHNVHLECYFGIPLAGAVMHTLNLRLSGEEIAWIAGHAKDRVLIVDDILLSLYRQVADQCCSDKCDLRHQRSRCSAFAASGGFFLPERIFAWWRGGSKVHRARTR